MQFTARRCALAFTLAVCTLALAEQPKSMLPEFGAEGESVNVAAQGDHKITGWLPNHWVDNSEWAAVSATYKKLPDPPKSGLTAVNIHVTALDEGHLQLTTWTRPTFKKDTAYIVAGYIRSKTHDGIKVAIREPGEPYEFYVEQDLEATPEWKPFSFEFTLDADRPAFVMFLKQETGSVDLSAITVHEKQ
jgi:hypothetical protein